MEMIGNTAHKGGKKKGTEYSQSRKKKSEEGTLPSNNLKYCYNKKCLSVFLDISCGKEGIGLYLQGESLLLNVKMENSLTGTY